MKRLTSHISGKTIAAFAVTALLMLGGCGHDGSDTDGTVATRDFTVTSFGPSADTKSVTVGAAATDASVDDDLPVTELATVSLDGKTITVSDGKGVRSYEITLLYTGTLNNFTFQDGGFVGANPAKESGTLATLSWEGDADIAIGSVLLTDAAGNTIQALVE